MTPSAPDAFVVDFPTLGFLAADWVAQHCIVPDGFNKGRPFEMSDWQLWCTANHYRVREDAVWDPDEPRVSTNFFYRRSQVVAPQKTGKGPWAAAIIALEGLGPTVFVGWAEGDELYECADYGCSCGWAYLYEPDEPMGIPRPTPLIQLTATAREQTANVYRPLKAMFRGSGLSFETASKTGEEFIRLPDDGRIDTVTSSAQSKLGNPVTFVLHDESGLYTKRNGMSEVADTQLRGLAGMDARAIETTNPWDPAQGSTAQATFESPVTDIFRFYRDPPAAWKFTNREERWKIYRFVYAGSPWVNLDAIEGLTIELMAKGETAQAERFYGNRRVRGAGRWLEDGLWGEGAPREVPDGSAVCGGFDGSDSNDWSAIRLETMDGYQFTPTYGPDERPCVWNPAEFGGKIPRGEVNAAWDDLNRRYKLVRVYCDPPWWSTEIEEWAIEYGEQKFLPWETYRPVQMHAALRRVVTDLSTGALEHDTCKQAALHFGNARKAARPGERYILTKPSDSEKIDIAMSGTLAHEAKCDAIAAGWVAEIVDIDRRVLVFRR